MTISIEGLPPNPNTRRHYMVVNKDNQYWKAQAYWAVKASGWRGKPYDKATIHYHISVGDSRAHDADNLIASLKPVQDGLKGLIIRDDSIDDISVSYSFDRAKPRGFTITVTEML